MIALVFNNSLTRKRNMLTTMVFNNSSFCSSFPINTKSPFLSQHQQQHHTFLSHIHNYTNPTILKYLKHKNQLSISGTHLYSLHSSQS
jgi:hypothetical protein